MTTDVSAVLHLRAAGVSFVMDPGGPHLPRVLHWGADLGPLGADDLATLLRSADTAMSLAGPGEPRRLSVLPTEAEGWSGAPGLAGHRAGAGTTPRFRLRDVAAEGAGEDGGSIRLALADRITGLWLDLTYRLDVHGVLTASAELENPRSDPPGGGPEGPDASHDAPYDLAELRILLPLPSLATEILYLTGRWTREHTPQRLPVVDGTHRRALRRGRTGFDTPLLTVVGTPAFAFRSGEVWAMHVAWSGNHESLVERLPEGAGVFTAVLGGGELLHPGEVRLAPGETYRSPDVIFAWSEAGLDGLSARLHGHLRDFSAHPGRPRPLVLNTWEAVYFDHDPARLEALAETAAELGVERFVLDDGWFLGRRDDTAGLGDWWVDPAVWPDGLRPLADRVRALGMEFGLWFEPEMVNPDSRLAREHPDWLLVPADGHPVPARAQVPLNLAHPEAWQFILDRIDSLVGDLGLAFIKWDHNRDLHESVRRDADGAERPGVHEQTLAFYALLDALRERHPTLEIESCSSGGARVDLGVLARAQRVWGSDCNDPVERQLIQRWTGLLVPPELVGTHVGPPRAHTTHRVTDLSFRLATALFGHAGIEWDVTTCDAAERDTIRAWAGLYRELRPLLHGGTTVRADLPYEGTILHGVVSPDRATAVFAWVRTTTSGAAQSGRVVIPGLDPARSYALRVRAELGEPERHRLHDPAWLAAAQHAAVTFPGSVLTRAGIPMPSLHPGQALILQLGSAG